MLLIYLLQVCSIFLTTTFGIQRERIREEGQYPDRGNSFCLLYQIELCIDSKYSSYTLQREEERPREKEKGKSRNIDHFMEELKREQEMRERRNQDRENWHDGRQIENSTVRISLIDSGFQFSRNGELDGISSL